MRPGDKQRIRADRIRGMIQRDRAFSISDVMNFPAVAAVAVTGKGTVLLLKRKFQGVAPDRSDLKRNPCFIVKFSNSCLFLLHVPLTFLVR